MLCFVIYFALIPTALLFTTNVYDTFLGVDCRRFIKNSVLIKVYVFVVCTTGTCLAA